MSKRAVCLDCGQDRRIQTRGLCYGCYRARLSAGTLAERPLSRQRTGGPCRLCGAPARQAGLCGPHFNAAQARTRAERAGRVYVPRGPRRTPPATPAPPARHRWPAPAEIDAVQPFACRQCGTTIRPRHSAGLCVDCVRAAGRLAPDPWEAA